LSHSRIRNFFAIFTPLVLAAMFLVGLVRLWGVPPEEMLSVLGAALLMLLGLIALALVAALLIRLIRRRFRG
jgi:polyferredoxin